jgi:membrane protease YdiL (CAAX protease family)
MEEALISETDNQDSKKQIWGPWATAGFGVVIIVITSIVQAVVGGIFIIAKLFSEPAPDYSSYPAFDSSQLEAITANLMDIMDANFGLLIALVTIASAIAGVGLILMIIKVRRGATIAEYLSLRSITGKTIVVLLVISIIYAFLPGLIEMMLHVSEDSEFMIKIATTAIWPALLWIAVIIFAPIFEEAFFRGFLFTGFLKSRLGAVGAIGLTSLTWAGFHLQYGLYSIASLFILGIILGIVRLKTGSLWGPMLMHAFNNLAAMVLVTIGTNSL